VQRVPASAGPSGVIGVDSWESSHWLVLRAPLEPGDVNILRVENFAMVVDGHSDRVQHDRAVTMRFSSDRLQRSEAVH